MSCRSVRTWGPVKCQGVGAFDPVFLMVNHNQSQMLICVSCEQQQTSTIVHSIVNALAAHGHNHSQSDLEMDWTGRMWERA